MIALHPRGTDRMTDFGEPIAPKRVI